MEIEGIFYLFHFFSLDFFFLALCDYYFMVSAVFTSTSNILKLYVQETWGKCSINYNIAVNCIFEDVCRKFNWDFLFYYLWDSWILKSRFIEICITSLHLKDLFLFCLCWTNIWKKFRIWKIYSNGIHIVPIEFQGLQSFNWSCIVALPPCYCLFWQQR
jgi:hypothetical protein